MTHNTPRPIIAMPATSTYLRALSEDCTNSLEAHDGTHDRTRSATLKAIPLPGGSVATIRCTRENGAIRASVIFTKPRIVR